MLYRSMTEFIAERFHSGENFITKLNSDLKLDALKPGTRFGCRMFRRSRSNR